MARNEEAVEAEIQAKGLNAPRLNPAHINGQILTEQFYVFPGTVTTVCLLTLQNGYSVVGKSAPASPANFDAELGKKIARDDARSQIWALEGYRLRSHLAEQSWT